MVGLQLKGFHHLCRMVGNTTKILIFSTNDGELYMGEAIGIKGNDAMSTLGVEWVYIYNNYFGYNKPNIDFFSKFSVYEALCKLNDKWTGAIEIYSKPNSLHMNRYSNNLRAMWLMPDTFYNDYEKFYSENKKQFSIIERKYTDKDTPMLKCLYALCNGSKNYFFWAVTQYFGHNVPLTVIKRILDWTNNYGYLSKNLNKGTVTAYNNKEQINDLLVEICELRKQKRIKDVINSFNTSQKKILKERVLSGRDEEVLSKFGKLSPIKKNNFIRKMSTVVDGDEIMKQMLYVVNVPFEWDKSALVDYITNNDDLHAEIVSNKGEIVLVRVCDYDAIKYLGKTTNWCISKNKTYWNQYINNDDKEPSTQYMVFDFSKPEDDVHSIIGFTSRFNNGITHAHDFVNHDLMTDRVRKRNVDFNSFMRNFNNSKGIFSILEADKISLSDVTSYEKAAYDWNRESFLKHLKECIRKDDYKILFDSENKMAVRIKNKNVSKLLGNYYLDNIFNETWKKEHFVFTDFSLPQNDPYKLVFGIVCKDEDTNEDFVTNMFNEHLDDANCSFDLKLAEYGLPYNVINRTDNVFKRFHNAINNCSIPIIRQLLENEELVNHLRNGRKNENMKGEFYETVYTSIVSLYTFDLLNLFYDKGITMSKLMGKENVRSLAFNLFNKMFHLRYCRTRSMTLPSAKKIKQFNDGTIASADDTLYIGLFEAIVMLIENENDINVLDSIIRAICRYGTKPSLFIYLMTKASELADYESLNDTTFSIVRFAVDNQVKGMLANISKHCSRQIDELMNHAKEGFNNKIEDFVFV